MGQRNGGERGGMSDTEMPMSDLLEAGMMAGARSGLCARRGRARGGAGLAATWLGVGLVFSLVGGSLGAAPSRSASPSPLLVDPAQTSVSRPADGPSAEAELQRAGATPWAAPCPDWSPRCEQARARVDSALPGFVLGVQWGGPGTTETYLPELGVSWARNYIAWNSIQPEIYDDTLTMDEVLSHPEYIEEQLETGNWASTDSFMKSLCDAGINVIPVIGAGWYNSYAMIEGEDATPDRLGQEAYMAYLYVHVAAVVERYDGDGYMDAPGVTVKVWQVENELNQAWFTALYGWREPSYAEGWNSQWRDFDFLTQLLQTLDDAVHYSDADAVTIQNIHTDIPAIYNHFYGIPSWEEAATLWRELVDVMGFDAYPNYYYADPINGEVVGERSLTIQQNSGLPVMLMEVGYPAGPAELGFTPEKQAEFTREAFDSLYGSGARGFFYFKLKSTYESTVELTDEDKVILAVVGHLFENERLVPLLIWALRNLDYIETHFIDVLQSVEPFWGLLDGSETRQPSFYTVQDIAAELAAQPTPAP